MSPATLSRRELLALLGVAGVAGVRLPSPAVFTRWGVQLYTLRTLLTQDFPGTLKAIADVGYREVETHSYFGRSPAEVRKILDDSGLTSPASHVPLEQVQGNLPALLDACAAIGHKWLVVPSLPGSYRSVDGYKRVGEILATAASSARSAGVRIAFHNHDAEFAPMGDTNGMELILGSSPADAVFAELDVYWIVRAGGDPFAFLQRHSGRVRMLHLKDSGGAPAHEMRDVGAGTIDWARFLPLAQRAGVEHAFVEHDRPTEALASIRASYAYLNRIGIPEGGR